MKIGLTWPNGFRAMFENVDDGLQISSNGAFSTGELKRVISFHCCCVCCIYLLVCNFSIVATCPSIQLPALLFDCVLFVLFVDVLPGEPKQN